MAKYVYSFDTENGKMMLVTFDPAGHYSKTPMNLLVESLGYIPDWLLNPQTLSMGAAQAIDAHYQHGGGWRSFNDKFELHEHGRLSYPGDPDMYPVCMYERGSEKIYQYPSGWVCCVSPEGSFDIARID